MRGRCCCGAEGTGPAGAPRFWLPRSNGSACTACGEDTGWSLPEHANNTGNRQRCSWHLIHHNHAQ